MNRWWAVALLVLSLVIVGYYGWGRTAAGYEAAVRGELNTKPASLKLRWEKEAPRDKQETVVLAVLEYDDADCEGFTFEAKHYPHRRKGYTDFKVSGPDGGEVFVMRFEQGDTAVRVVDEKVRGKMETLKKRCREIRTALVKVLGPGRWK
jgi:hypothetical protein